VTEKSTRPSAARESGSQTGSPDRIEAAEVRSRADQWNQWPV